VKKKESSSSTHLHGNPLKRRPARSFRLQGDLNHTNSLFCRIVKSSAESCNRRFNQILASFTLFPADEQQSACDTNFLGGIDNTEWQSRHSA
jgi:hypothetical protein